MKQKNSILWAGLAFCLYLLSCNATRSYKEGIVQEEFIFEQAPFPSSHAATIVETTNGTLLASWFGGTYERNPDVCIYVSRYLNGKWTAPKEVANGIVNDTLRYPTWNPVLFQVPNGDLQLYYKIGERPDNWQGWMKISKDDGLSWSEASSLPPGFIGPVKNKPVFIDNKIICPSSSEEHGWRVHFEISDDWGKTWDKVPPINDGVTLNAIQPSILTYPDGRLQVLCRSKNRAILESWSDDKGKSWSPMQKTSLPNNNSGTDAVTLSNGDQVLVYNHVLPPGNKYKGIRTPLNVAVSHNGKDWYAALVLDSTPEQPENRFSYPAIIQTRDGMIHILYTWKRVKIKHIVVDPSKMKLTKIENGIWPG